MTKRIAVIGSGISGLVSASLLSERYDVSLFEANDYLGGHTCTVDVTLSQQTFAIDTGFVVFNKQTYPNFCRLINKYNIPFHPTEMSFSFRSDSLDLEYNGHNLNTLFADRRNLTKPAFYGFIKEILRFNHDAKRFLVDGNPTTTVAEFAKAKKYNSLFLDGYLVPIIAAIWSKSPKDVWACPARFLFQFFFNHGLINVFNRPQWYVISGGSRSYIPSLIKNIKHNIHLNTKIEKLERSDGAVILSTKTDTLKFDAVVVAVHSDQALQLLRDASEHERSILGAISYQENEAILHTDTRLLPQRKLAWASWNYYDIGAAEATLTYYMNRLQNITAPDNICLSVNLTDRIAPDKILQRFSYAHPRFTEQALQAQKQYPLINGKNNTYYCGAYWGFGFHEDGVNSALEACKLLGVTL